MDYCAAWHYNAADCNIQAECILEYKRTHVKHATAHTSVVYVNLHRFVIVAVIDSQLNPTN